MAQAGLSSSTSRRRFLHGVGAAAVVAPIAALSAGHADAALLVLERLVKQAARELDVTSAALNHAAIKRMNEACTQMAEARATTMVGLQAKARCCDHDGKIAFSIVDDLLALAGGNTDHH